jgi:hypothetical protein
VKLVHLFGFIIKEILPSVYQNNLWWDFDGREVMHA